MANLDQFTHYYGRHKDKINRVAQNNVAQNKTKVLRARVSQSTYSRFAERCSENGITESELLRQMIDHCLKEVDNADWEEELKEMYN